MAWSEQLYFRAAQIQNCHIEVRNAIDNEQRLLYNSFCVNNNETHAEVMELADVVDSKSTGSDTVPVRVRPPAPNQYNPNPIFPIGDGFGFVVFFEYSFFPNGAKHRRESKPRGPRKKHNNPDI